MVENLKIRQFRIAARDFKNKITGKQELIDTYENILQKIAVASDKADATKKATLIEAYQELDETTFKSKGSEGIFYADGFNPYKASKKVLESKIALGRNLLAQLKVR